MFDPGKTDVKRKKEGGRPVTRASSKNTQQGLVTNLKNIEYLIDGNGDITIGSIGPIQGAATACDEHRQLAALVRRPGESLQDLLFRLDAAIERAWEDDVLIDEING